MMTRPCDALPPVRGTYAHGAALKDLVWFRAGGAAEVLFRPADADDLATFLAARSPETRVSVIGVGSNLLVRDGGIPGVVIRLPAAFGKIAVDGTRVRMGAAALDAAVSSVARRQADEEMLAKIAAELPLDRVVLPRLYRPRIGPEELDMLADGLDGL